MRSSIFISLVLLILCYHFSMAQSLNDSIKSRPYYANLQFAGNVGLASIGLGTSFKNEKIYLGLIYGYLPKSLNDAAVHTIALKTYFRIFSRQLFSKLYTSANFGTNINYGITKNTYLKYPNYFPDGYYYTNAIHIAPFLGRKYELVCKSQQLGISRLGLYFEIGTMDKYLANLFTSRQISVFDVFNLSTGITFCINTNTSFNK
ncbi:MAG: hypothetical protein HC905_25335 [Bacteroidales bacterium]|nr:hypothetical protein [Bacteroidales bacterium]